ncbi:hypothetical protein AgCh_000915 [Apium graveolens]
MEKRLADLSNAVEEMSANEVSWFANTHTLVSIFDILDDLCRVEKIVDDDNDDLKQLKVSQPAQYTPHMFDEIPEKVYVVQIPTAPLYAPTSVVFHVEPTERALAPILCSELSNNDFKKGYNLHENEYGKVFKKLYVNFKNMMDAINVFTSSFERVYDKVLMYKLHQNEYVKFEILEGSSKHICELEVLEKGILFSISLNYFYGVGSLYKTVMLVFSLPVKELVPCNIFQLRVGNKVPADMRVFILITSTIRVEQRSLTGDSEAVSKSVEPVVGDVPFGEIISLRCIKIKEIRKTNKNNEKVYVIKEIVKGK